VARSAIACDAEAEGRSALDGDLDRLKTGAPGGWPSPRAACSAVVAVADPGRAVHGAALGRQPAVRPQGAKAELPVRLR
jgi:hypothetical protein